MARTNLRAMSLAGAITVTKAHPRAEEYAERFRRVLEYVLGHLDEDCSLTALAEIAGLSPFHFHRVFLGVTGERVGRLVRRLRLERAAWQLVHSDRQIIQIALEAGYEAHEAFTRSFRAAYAMTPSELRKAQPSVLWLQARSGVHFVDPPEKLDFVPQFNRELTMKVEIRTIEPMRVAYLRGRGPYQQMFPELWKRFCALAQPRGLFTPTAKTLSICVDDPETTAPADVRGDACITVDASFQGDDALQVQTIPAGRYAVAAHVGPYKDLHKTWNALCGQWIPANGYRIRQAPCFEVYVSDPRSTPEGELLTEVFEPIDAR